MVLRLSTRLWAEYRAQVRGRKRRARQEQRREQLIIDHLDMVERIARKLGKLPFLWHVKLEDLIADGRLGLCEASVRYRPHMGCFEHYAYFRIRGAIIDPQRRQGMWERDGPISIEQLKEQFGFIPGHSDVDPAPRPDARLAELEKRRQMWRAVRFLAEPERSVILAHLEGKSLVVIAQQHGRGVTWARARLAAAKAEVGQLVKGRAA